MIIAHLPAGYVCTTFLLNLFPVPQTRRAAFMRLGLVASVVPDFDMLYFYTLDRQQHLHHSYITHWPSFWLSMMMVGIIAGWVLRRRGLVTGALVVGCNTLLHLVLDSITGGIHWVAPFSDYVVTLVEVPARYKPWFLNFLLYWTFVLEIVLVLLAWLVWNRKRQRMHTTQA